MSREIKDLKRKIEEIEDLKTKPDWGAEYRIWRDLTEELVKKIFGDRGLKLFRQDNSVVLDDEAYIRELNSRKITLNGLLNNRGKYRPKNESGPVAIKVEKLKDATIEGNITVGMRLLEADEIEGGSIKRNKTFNNGELPSKGKIFEKITNNQTAAIIISAIIIAIIGYIIYKTTGYNPFK